MRRTLTLMLLLVVAAPLAAQGTLDLAGATINYAASADEMEIFAARELGRYLRLLSGRSSRIVVVDADSTLGTGPRILLGTQGANLPGLPDVDGEQAYVLRASSFDGVGPALHIAGASPVAVQYGVYSLLEKLGVGFYLGGDALPPPRKQLLIRADLDETAEPVFAIRGSLPWYNFLNSPTTWDLQDYQYFFNQMAKMKNNFVGFHSYDSEPFCAYPWEGKWRMGAPAATSLTYGWGTIRNMACEEFGFGTGRLFSSTVFGSRSMTDAQTPPEDATQSDVMPWATLSDDAIVRAQCVLAQGLQYASDRGINTCLGFELHGDPTDPELRKHAEARIRHMLATYPMLEYVWFWQQEGRGAGSEPPAPDSPLDLIIQRHRPAFEYLGNDQRIAEAARVAAWMEFADGVVSRLRPNVKVAVSGWGGDRWMRFSDFYIGLDSILADDVIFAALDNIDPAWEPNVSAAYGQLSPEREKWPIPWFESDGGGARRDQWAPQANVKPFTALTRDALAKDCDGLLGIHWQTRGIEEVAAYAAQFAWSPDLTYEDFYRDYATNAFGDEAMAQTLMRLEELGPRWTGSLGQVECGRFAWFSSNDRPAQDKLAALREIREGLDHLSPRHWTQWDRVHYLRATIDFLLAFDEAALVLEPGAEVDVMLTEAEKLKQAGDAETARRLARKALKTVRDCPLDEAVWAYVPRLTTQGDFGNLATINIKAYAAYEALWKRAEEVLGEPQFRQAPRRYGELVVKHLPTAIPEGTPLAIEVISSLDSSAQGVAPVQLNYWSPRDPDPGTFVQMAHVGGRVWRYKIPAEEVGPEGLEFRVTGAWVPKGGGDLPHPGDFWPSISPNSYSITTMPNSGPRVYGPHLHRDMALVPWTGDSGEPATLRCTVIAAEAYSPAKVELALDDTRLSAHARYHTALFPLPTELLSEGALRCATAATDRQGRQRPGALVGFGRPAPPRPATDVAAEVVGPFHARVAWVSAPCATYEVHRSAEPGFEPTSETLLSEWAWTTFDDVTLQPDASYEYAIVAVDDLRQKSDPARSGPLAIADFPLLLAPTAVTAAPGLARATVAWQKLDQPTRGYAVFAAEGEEWRRVSGEDPLAATQMVVGGLVAETEHRFRVQAVDRAGRLGEASVIVAATPVKAPHEPVFEAGFGGVEATTGQAGTLNGKARTSAGALDVSEGGWIAYPSDEMLQVSGPLSVEMWVRLSRAGAIPVMLSFGHWEAPGYWLQFFGGKVRWYLPVQKIVDGGTLSIGEWHHICATYDGMWSRLHVDGAEVGAKEIGPVDGSPWTGELRVGMYSDVEEQFQSFGQIDDVRIYQRTLSADEIESRFADGRSE